MVEKRNVYLDWIRAISGIMVVIYHYTIRYEQLFGHIQPYSFSLQYGSYGVLTFFVLSGYLTIRSIDKTEPTVFVNKRFFRLYPAFCVSLIITMISTTLFLPELAVGIKDFFLNFTMVPLLFRANYVDGAYWTLLCEISFYFVVFIICIFKLQKHTIKIIYVWFFFQLCILMLPSNGAFLLIRKVNDLLYFHCFVIGTIIALLEKRLLLVKNQLYFSDFGIIAILIFSVSIQFIGHEISSGLFLIIATVLISMSVVLYDGGVLPSTKVSILFRPLVWVATISYPMYLLHQNIGFCIIKNMESFGFTSEIYIIIPFVLILLMSWLIHTYVEKPISMLSRKLVK